MSRTLRSGCVMSVAALAALGMLSSVMVSAQGRAFPAVTDDMLRHPSPDDWLAWRGTTKSQGYSPLTQITRDNVSQLQLVWSWVMEAGQQEAAPIVHAGVMYLANPGGTVQALDGATGDLLWEYRPPPAPDERTRTRLIKGLSLYGDKVFLGRPDAHLVALDARSGQVVWDVEVTPPDFGASYNTAPVVARGTVIAALKGCLKFAEEKCFISGHDAHTGKERWRTYTIPKEGQPGSETWGNVPMLYRAGTDMWIGGSYDPDLHLVYWSTSQAKAWARAARGTDGGDELYANTTLALDPDTGKIVWYRQTLPGDTHDFDEAFESVLVDRGARKSLFKMGKIGILWELDRTTGQIVNATDLGYQNVLDLHPKTGAVTYKPEMIPKLNEELDHCPSSAGVKNWPAMAYSPETQALYIPITPVCAKQIYIDVEKVPGGGGFGNGGITAYPHPKGGGNLGAITAITTAGTVLWVTRQRAVFTTAAVTTAGGLVFAGDYNRYFRAYDVKTGQVLWQTRTPSSPEGFPMSYAVGGRQYIAVPVGTGMALGAINPGGLTPEIQAPRAGNALMVFALPQQRSGLVRPLSR